MPEPHRLIASHCEDVIGRRLIVLDGMPGNRAELYPKDLRALARQLIQIANDADQGATGLITYPDDLSVNCQQEAL